MSALALALLLGFAPPAEPPAEPAPVVIEPPPPTIPREEGPRPAPEPEPERGDSPEGLPSGTAPPGEAGEVSVPEDHDPLGIEVEERALGDLPYGATAARKSAVRRGNDVLVRPFRKPLYSVGAVARFGVAVAGARDIIQPFAWGLALQLRLHFVRVVRSRFGIELHAGHTRWGQRDDFQPVEGEAARVTRQSLLSHTDVSLGPSFEIPLGPLFLQVGGSGGFAVSTLVRPRSSDSSEDERIGEFDPLVRGGLSLGIPLANRQGITLGAGVHQVFSRREVSIDPLGTEASETTRPFGTWVETFLGYQVWF